MAYEGVARDLVAALKFRAALPVANLMAAHMAANLPPALRGPDVAPAEPRTAADRNGAPLANPGAAPWHDPAPANPGAAPWHDPALANPGATPCDVAALPAIVPVPTVAGRRRRRGFDPAGVLAAALARRLERPLVDCLERRDHAGRQVGTSRRGRRAPGRLEFVARAPPPRVLLVDDVHTTGATLDAAARALLAAGAVSVAALSYARTL
jgi:predicted amidophosphoribosyltransferase